ncbi:MAG: hypothetical protein HY602_00490, partial [Parcubacteria group bacterium]|nr:hypothetical protein [Parcubacteria group bacterium]
VSSVEKLADIYKLEGQTDGINTIERPRWPFWKHVLLALLFLAIGGGAAFGGYQYWKWRQTPSVLSDIKLQIHSDEELVSGEEAVYLIDYLNLGSVDLNQAVLNLRYPAGFILASAIPEPSKEHVWELGTIAAAGAGQIKLKGKMVGEIDETKTLTAVLSYMPANFNSEFQTVASFTAAVKSSDLDIVLDGPQKAYTGEKVVYGIHYKSVSQNVLDMVRIQWAAPVNFSILSVTPPFKSKEDNTWEIFGAGFEGDVRVEGVFGNLGSEEDPSAVGIRGYLKAGDTFYLQKSLDQKVAVLGSDVSLGLVINGAYQSQPAGLGDTLQYKVFVKNNSDAVFEGVQIKLFVESKSDFLNLNTQKKKFHLIQMDDINAVPQAKLSLASTGKSSDVFETAVLKWSEVEYQDLEEIAPDEEKEFNITLKLKDAAGVFEMLGAETIGGLSLTSYIEAEIEKIGGRLLKRVSRSQSIDNAIHSDVALATIGRYFNEDGTPGAGPLPPVVGKETTYKIEWKLLNSVHELSNIEVSAILPEYVKWSVKKELSAGELDYNFQTRRLRWKINRMPLSVKELKAAFEIILQPTSEQVGQIVVLIPKTLIMVTDAYIGKSVTLSAPGLTSSLEHDARAQGMGIIAQE